ncbi:MAG: MmcQ/YjbR family DNA-binding protein [Bacteroidota bacterium]
MNYDALREYCLSKPGTTEGLPFGPDTLVFKVMGKMFAVAGLNEEEPRVNLKCDPERAIELRETYPEGIIPGWHANKKHWNTVYLERGLNESLLLELVDHSYDLVVQGLPKKIREELEY